MGAHDNTVQEDAREVAQLLSRVENEDLYRALCESIERLMLNASDGRQKVMFHSPVPDNIEGLF